jgi:hypothetical protein
MLGEAAHILDAARRIEALTYPEPIALKNKRELMAENRAWR